MRPSRGFTLVELMCALLILSIVITTTLAVFVERTRRARQASELILAYQVLANEAEVVRRVDYGDLDDLAGEFTTDSTLIEPLSPFETEVEVEVLTPGVKSVTLSITWRTDQVAALTLLRSDTGGTNLW